MSSTAQGGLKICHGISNRYIKKQTDGVVCQRQQHMPTLITPLWTVSRERVKIDEANVCLRVCVCDPRK